MAKVTYVSTAGAATTVDVPNGWTVMEGAVRNSVAGIEAECGGCCACATCHVYVADAWLGKLPSWDEAENDMLNFTASPRQPNSRLSCQLKVSPTLDGLVVHLPETQI
jgi:2Fe-2S ferredoxin